MGGPGARRLTSPAALLAAAWLAAVAVIAALQAAGGGPRTAALACSPARLAAGHVWTLLSSALVIDGPPVIQLAGTAVVIGLVVHDLGARAFWGAALAGHVGATLAAYAGIGLLWLLARGSVESIAHAPDYGISAVWAGALGALAVTSAWRPASHRRLAVALGALALFALVVLVPLHGELADVEHLLAFVLGAGVAAGVLRSRGRLRDAAARAR
jgi:hypothetical protein